MGLSFYVHKEGKAIITGLSTDTKPVSPVTGLIFIEEDTSKLFRSEAGIWIEKLNSAYATVPLETEIDIGTMPIIEASISVIDTGVSTLSKIIGGMAYKAPTGKDLDELEMDAIEVKFEPLAGSFNVKIKGLEGYIADKFKIWYAY